MKPASNNPAGLPLSVADDLADRIGGALAVAERRDILEWCEDNIDFSDDISSERKRFDISLSPFLADPLRAWQFTGKIREVAVCGIEQHGKTMLEAFGVLYSMVYNPCSMLCVYPSDDLAADVNRTKYVPLVKHIPQLAAELTRPRSVRRDRYIFGGSTMFFQGAGVKVMSRSCKIRVLDEEDQYPTVKNLDAVEDTRKRGRSYSESILYRVCTPTENTGSIWRAFLAGSQGYWTLRCRACGELTMRSCDFANFQFESTFDDDRGLYLVKPDSIRLICPKCHHEHTEADKRWMNLNGAYVHQFPERVDLKPSFQFGALASQFASMAWPKIAEKILECGKRSDIKSHYELDNSYKGLPYSPRTVSADDCRHLQEHFYRPDQLPPADEIEFVFLVSDTQDDFSPTGVFALDVHDNIWLIEYANITHLWLAGGDRESLEHRTGEKVKTVEDIMNSEISIHGEKIRPLFQVIDYRGHRQKEIAGYASTHSRAILYAGAGARQLETFKNSRKSRRLFYVSAHLYQKQLIWALYRQRDKTGDYLYLPEDLDGKFQAEIVSVQPDRTTKNGHLPENWKPEHDAVHDAFDVLKMAYFARDFAFGLLPPTMFRRRRSPGLRRTRKNWFEQNEPQPTQSE